MDWHASEMHGRVRQEGRAIRDTVSACTRQDEWGPRVIPILLVGLFALGVWFTHEAWTSPVSEEVSSPPRRLHRVQEFLHRTVLHHVTPRNFDPFTLGACVVVGT